MRKAEAELRIAALVCISDYRSQVLQKVMIVSQTSPRGCKAAVLELARSNWGKCKACTALFLTCRGQGYLPYSITLSHT